jgi:hypothetical protein
MLCLCVWYVCTYVYANTYGMYAYGVVCVVCSVVLVVYAMLWCYVYRVVVCSRSMMYNNTPDGYLCIGTVLHGTVPHGIMYGNDSYVT